MKPHDIVFDKTSILNTTYIWKRCFSIGIIFRFLHCACSVSEISCEIKTLLSTCRTPSTSPICLRPTPPPPLPPALGLRKGEREFLRLSGETKLLRPRKETNSRRILPTAYESNTQIQQNSTAYSVYLCAKSRSKNKTSLPRVFRFVNSGIVAT